MKNPCSFSMNVCVSVAKSLLVPNQANLLVSGVTVVPKSALRRTSELAPSAATTRSYPFNSSTEDSAFRYCGTTPARAAQDYGQVGPLLHVRRDGVVGFRVVAAQELQRLVGEHHAEAEGGVGRVL